MDQHESSGSIEPAEQRNGARRFRIKRRVGHGGFATVYQAIDSGLGNQIVALKCLDDISLLSEESSKRITREVLIARSLKHPNIVSVFEYLVFEDRPTVVMEFVEGDTLDGIIRRQAADSLGIADKIDLLLQIATALSYAHDKGIVHRDVKPQNVLITRDGVAKLSDFGLARSLEDDQRLTRTGASLGTPSYMAPEQFLGTEAGPETDVYAFGILAYELLTGSKPFTSEVYLKLALQHLHEPLPEGDFPADVPQWLEIMTRRCVSKLPADRFSSFHLIKDILEEGSASRPSSQIAASVAISQRKARIERISIRSRRAIRRMAIFFVCFFFYYFARIALAQLGRGWHMVMSAEVLFTEAYTNSILQYPAKSLLHLTDLSVNDPDSIFRAIEIDRSQAVNGCMVGAMLIAGADPNVHNAQGETPLHLLLGNNFCNSDRLALEHGADINSRDNKGETPFFVAVRRDAQTDLIAKLFPSVDLRLKDNRGSNILHYAVRAGNVRLVERILEDPVSKELLLEKDSASELPVTAALFLTSANRDRLFQTLLERSPLDPALGRELLMVAISHHYQSDARRIFEKIRPAALPLGTARANSSEGESPAAVRTKEEEQYWTILETGEWHEPRQ